MKARHQSVDHTDLHPTLSLCTGMAGQDSQYRVHYAVPQKARGRTHSEDVCEALSSLDTVLQGEWAYPGLWMGPWFAWDMGQKKKELAWHNQISFSLSADSVNCFSKIWESYIPVTATKCSWGVVFNSALDLVTSAFKALQGCLAFNSSNWSFHLMKGHSACSPWLRKKLSHACTESFWGLPPHFCPNQWLYSPLL